MIQFCRLSLKNFKLSGARCLHEDYYRPFVQYNPQTSRVEDERHHREEYVVTNPATGEILCTVASPAAQDVRVAINHAHDVYMSGVWSQSSAVTRSAVLSRIANLLEKWIPDVARIETLQTGRAIREMNAQMSRLPEWLHYYSALLRTHPAFVTPMPGKLINYVHRVPLGVVAQITPFNHPLFIAVKKIAPALAAGNSVIVKPSELTPISLLEFSKLIEDAGVPPGVFTVLPGGGATTGKEIVSSSLIRKVDITGGTAAGKAIGASVGANLAAFTAELGGKAPILVFEDADLSSAVNGVAFAAFIASGQTCVSGTRIIIQDSVYDQFLKVFLEKVKNITRRMGDPLNLQCSMGSIVSASHLKRIESMVYRRPRGNIMIGGERMTGLSELDGFDFSRGSFYAPTVISDVEVHDELWQEEVFGPVVVVKRFSDEAEGVKLANASKYGLGAGIWTTDLSRAHRVAAAIEAGIIWVNTHHRNDPSSPWGGMKDSGIGRENGVEALEAYSQTKSVVVNVASSEENRQNDDWFVESGEEKRYG